MQLHHISLPALIDAAGGDPWLVNNTLQSGSPAVIDELAQAFHNAGACTTASSAAFAEARRRFQAAWNRENGEHPINDSLEVQRATTTLHLQQTQLAAIGTDLENIAAALAEAQKSAAKKIHALEIQLQDIDNRIGMYQEGHRDTAELEQIAIDDTAGILLQIEKIRDDYTTTLQASTTTLLSDGYDPAPLHGYDADGQPNQDQQTDRAADTYRTAQHQHDQELVTSPGEMTPEKVEAAARLRDYATVTDPAAHPDARHLAAERLDDFRMAHFIGPLPPDRTIGGDARTRAQTRLDLQKDLEHGLGDGRTFAPDQATGLLDTAEQRARVIVTQQAIEALVSNSGMTRQGATQFVDDIKSGAISQQYLDGVNAAGTGMGTMGGALTGYADSLPNGKHWAPGVAYSVEDLAAIRKIARGSGIAGTIIGIGEGGYEIFGQGKPIVDVGTRFLGSAGGLAMGTAAATLLLGPIGPAAVFCGALALGGLGSYVGEAGAEELLAWVRD